jgi:hypothetical protein
LCLHKCKAFLLNDLTDEAHAGLTGLGVQVLPHTGPDAGLMVLGTPVGTSAYQQGVVSANEVTEALAKLPIIERCLQRKPHRALPTVQGFNRLLRMCITAQLTHLLRTVPPCDWLAEAARFDRALYNMWARCIAGMPAEWRDADCPLAAQRLVDQLFLPLDGGGFGFTSAARVALVGYIASWALVGQTLTEALGPTVLEGEGEQRRLRDDWVPGLVGAFAQPALAGLEALAKVNTTIITQAPMRKLQSAACRELAMAAQQRVADSLPIRELRVAFLSATHPYSGVALATSPQLNKIGNEEFRLLVLLLLPVLPGGLTCPCKAKTDMDVYGKHAAACNKHSPTARHDHVLAKLERNVRAVLGSKYEVVAEHAMNALFKRAAGVEDAKIADLRVRSKQVPGGVPTDVWWTWWSRTRRQTGTSTTTSPSPRALARVS